MTCGVRIAAIVRARIAVITDDGFALAYAGHTMVALGTGAAVEALAAVQGRVYTATFGTACVFRTGIAIVTGAFIDITITVVIDAVANLQSRG